MRDVGRAHAGEHRQQRLGALLGGVQRQPVDLVPVDLEQLAAAAGEAPGRASAVGGPHRELGDHPVASPVLLHAGIDDGELLAVLEQEDGAIEQPGQDQHLVVAGLEAAHVDRARGEQHRGRLDRGDASHRDEDPVPVLNLDDQTEDARRLPVDPQARHRFANATELVAIRIEDADTRELGDEDPARGHASASVSSWYNSEAACGRFRTCQIAPCPGSTAASSHRKVSR